MSRLANTRHSILASLGLVALLQAPCLAQEPVDPATPVATTDTFVVTVGEVLAWLNEHSARQVIDERVTEALVVQRAAQAGVPVPDDASLLAQYADFLRELAAARGFADEEAPLADLVASANIEGYFADAGLTSDAVLRRIKIMTLAEAILSRETQISDEELDAELPRLRPLVVSPEQRKIGLYVRDAQAEASQLAAELRDAVAHISGSLPEGVTLGDVIQTRLPPWDQDVFWAAPGSDADPGPLVTTAFALPSVGSVSDPVSIDGRYAVVVVLRIIPATDAVVGAESMTPEQLADAQRAVEAQVRRAAHDYLLAERVDAMLPDWLAELRAEGNAEILWRGPVHGGPED